MEIIIATIVTKIITVAQATFFRIYLNLRKNNILFCIRNEIIIWQETILPLPILNSISLAQN